MPQVPTYDSPQVKRQPLRAPSVDSVLAPAQPSGASQIGSTLTKAGEAATDIVVKMQERENADSVFRAEVALKDEYLQTEQDWRKNRQGRFAKDLTTDATKWWDEAVKKKSESLGNERQQRAFAHRVASLRGTSLTSVSHFEATQLEHSHDEAWAADKNASVNLATQNPTFGKPPIRNADGSVSTERTITVEADGRHFVVPTIVGGKQLSRDDAVKAWQEGGNRHVGDFASAEEADKYAKKRTEEGGGLGTVDRARLEIERLNRYQAVRKGWEPSRLEAENLKDTTVLHENVIRGLAQKDPVGAAAYFEANKKEIDGKRHDEIGKFAKDVSANAIGDQAAGAIWTQHGPKTDNDPANVDEMEKMAREALKGNESAMKAAIASIRERTAAFDKGTRERAAANAASVSTAAMNGTSLAAIRAMPEFQKLDGTKQAQMIEHIENTRYTRAQRGRQEAEQADVDMGRRNNAAYLIYSDPVVLKDMSRNQVLALLPSLGRTYTEHLAQKWDSLEKGGARVIEAKLDTEDFNHVAQGAGLKPFDPKKSEDERAALGELKFRIENIIDGEQAKAKRPLNRVEKMQIFQREIDNKVLVDEWGRDPTKSMILLTPKELEKAYVMVDGARVDLAKIPAADRAAIITARQRRNLPVTEQAIAQTWLRASAKKPAKTTVADVNDPKYIPQ